MPAQKTLEHSPADWWNHAVIYQIYPRSFADANGDGVGDIPGIMSKLPHIADLGVDAIWLSPFYTSPQKDAGYDVADYCSVDPIFGSLDDAEKLIDEAHNLGLRIIVDVVPNHSSDQHVWFQQALAAVRAHPNVRGTCSVKEQARAVNSRPTTGNPCLVDLPGRGWWKLTDRLASGTCISSTRVSQISIGRIRKCGSSLDQSSLFG